MLNNYISRAVIKMFGTDILNGKQLRDYLHISTTMLYQLIREGLSYHQLTNNSRKYYNRQEIIEWLMKHVYRTQTTWTK